MKMGTIVSPWRYEVAAGDAIRPDNQRRTAILRYASWAAVFPISRVVRLPFGGGHFDQSRERRDGPGADSERWLREPVRHPANSARSWRRCRGAWSACESHDARSGALSSLTPVVDAHARYTTRAEASRYGHRMEILSFTRINSAPALISLSMASRTSRAWAQMIMGVRTIDL